MIWATRFGKIDCSHEIVFFFIVFFVSLHCYKKENDFLSKVLYPHDTFITKTVPMNNIFLQFFATCLFLSKPSFPFFSSWRFNKYFILFVNILYGFLNITVFAIILPHITPLFVVKGQLIVNHYIVVSYIFIYLNFFQNSPKSKLMTITLLSKYKLIKLFGLAWYCSGR